MMFNRIKKWILKENTLVFFFCWAVISGPAIATLFAFDLSQSPDCSSYLGIAHFDFDQSPVRRFRVIVPFIAAGLNYVFGGVFNKLAPTYFVGDFGIPFSFFLVNSLLISYFGLLIYKFCKAYQTGTYAALLGVLVMLTCRYTAYIAGLPLVDSLFCVVVAMSLLGIKERNTPMLVSAMFLGPFAKESFIFIAPLIFFFSHIPKTRTVFYLLVSGILVFSYRYIYELYAPPTYVSGLEADWVHYHNLIDELPNLLSFKGMYKLVSNPWLWLAIPATAAMSGKSYFRTMKLQLDKCLFWFMVSVMVQVLLSGSFERMFYISMPFWSLLVALSSNELKKLYMSAEK
jgi:hypothetical protein